MNKLVILTDFFPPAFKAGGPVRSVSNLVDQIKNTMEILVVTGDRDLGDVQGFADLDLNKIIQNEGFKTVYLSPDNQNSKNLEQIIVDFDPNVIYLNSLFSGSFTVKPLFKSKKIFKNKKIVLAPRGMLHVSALNKKKLKKRLFLSFAKSINLFENVIWHATSEEEESRILKEFGTTSEIHIIPNLAQHLVPRKQLYKSKGILSMMFYGRISKEKNLHKGLEILMDSNLQDVSLHIYGPIEDEKYWEACKKQIEYIEKSNRGIKISYQGLISPEHLQNIMEKYHLLYSPSGSENFGHSIVEAMSSGMPALISDNTPWNNLESYKAGVDLSLESKGNWIEAINMFRDMDIEEYKLWSEGAVEYSKKVMKDANARKAYIELLS